MGRLKNGFRQGVSRMVGAVMLCGMLSATSFAQSQTWLKHWGVGLGTSHYLGDIGGSEGWGRNSPFDAQFRGTRISVAGWSDRMLGSGFRWRTSFQVAQLRGDDAWTSNPARRARNLHFRNTTAEVASRLVLQVYTGKRTDTRGPQWGLFVSTGVGVFYHSPHSRIRTGGGDENLPIWYALRPLRTEGQERAYAPVALSWPIGVGAHWPLEGGYRVGVELVWRFTSTDYLDDVSGLYANPATMDPLGAVLASQANEVSVAEAGPAGGSVANHQYSVSGTARGNPDRKDGFATLQITLSRDAYRGGFRSRSWGGRGLRTGLRLR
jgi:hypothetical protein